PGAVYADLDTEDRCHPRPRPPADLNAPPIECAPARQEVGEAGRNQERAGTHPLNRLSRVVGAALVPVRDALLVTVEPSGQSLDANEPLDVRHAIPTWDQQPQRGPVLRLERPTVHLVGQQDLRARRCLEGQAARVVVLIALLDPMIGADEEDLD